MTIIELLQDYISNEWRTREEILRYLKLNRNELTDRQFRKFVEAYDMMYCKGSRETYIAHSNKGYMLTADLDIIRQSAEDDLTRAYKLLKRGKGVKRKLRDDDQLTLLPEEEDLFDAYEVFMKVGQ